jgi:drug/metabolite transporter (DMT)-like permease
MSLEAVFATIFGALFLREIMSVRELLGAAIIFAAVIISQIDIKRRDKCDETVKQSSQKTG